MNAIKFYLVKSNNPFLNSVIIKDFGKRFDIRELKELFREASNLIPEGGADYCNIVAEFRGNSHGEKLVVYSAFDERENSNLETQLEWVTNHLKRLDEDVNGFIFNENLSYLI